MFQEGASPCLALFAAPKKPADVGCVGADPAQSDITIVDKVQLKIALLFHICGVSLEAVPFPLVMRFQAAAGRPYVSFVWGLPLKPKRTPEFPAPFDEPV